MNTPIADALTRDETRGTAELLELAVIKHDRRGDTLALMRDLHTIIEYMQRCAYSIPSDEQMQRETEN